MLQRLLLLGMIFCLPFLKEMKAQSPVDLKKKEIGFFISGKNFHPDPTFNLKYAQFLKLGEEDRSYSGKFKNELIIRLGQFLEKQLPEILESDTVYFMNAIARLGLNFRSAYDSLDEKLYGDVGELESLDYILYLESYRIKHRIHRSVYIQSNRMVTERIPIEMVEFEMLLISPKENRLVKRSRVCFDRQKDKVSQNYFDFYASKSAMGKFLGNSFSAWWLDLEGEGNYSCE